MTTPLQKAAKKIVDCWQSEMTSLQCLFPKIEELRKALDAEIAQTETVDRNLRVTEQAVEPDFYTACAEHNGGWIPLPGYSDETVHGVKSLILEDARKEGWKGTIEGRLFALGWQVMPLYLHPPHPQATTAVPDGLLEAIRLSGHTLVKTKFGYRIIDAGTVTAQGEKP